MYETSGILKPAIQAYLERKKTLSAEQIAILRAYFRQWIESGVWDNNLYATNAAKGRLRELRSDIDNLTSVDSIDRWLQRCLEEGLDPL
jgi:hypothetical protein